MKVLFYWVFYPLIRPFYLAALIVDTVVLSLTIIIVSIFDRNGDIVHYMGKFWSLLNIYLSGTKLSIKGKEKIEKNKTYIVMSNHQSLFDVWALIGKLPLQLRWIIKADIRRIPIFGLALERMGHIYIDKKRKKDTMQSLERAIKKIREGTSVVIFPEGTRSLDGRLLPFRKGGAAIALQAHAPILPITINGSRFVLPKGTLGLMPGKIQIIVGDVIDPSTFGPNDRDKLIEKLKASIGENIDLAYGDLR